MTTQAPPVSSDTDKPYHGAMRQSWTDYRVFWRQFREAYHTTGAVLPSGPALAAALSRYVREPGEAASAAGTNGSPTNRHSTTPRRILEVGPGTGAVTTHIIRHMSATDTLDLVERNEQFVARLRERIAGDPAFQPIANQISLIHSAVEDLPEDRPYDLIISGLPLNNFEPELVEQILAKFGRLLAPDGTLSFFEYVAIRRAKSLISRRADRERLRRISQIFGDLLHKREVHRDLVLLNVPPAWVHHVRLKA